MKECVDKNIFYSCFQFIVSCIFLLGSIAILYCKCEKKQYFIAKKFAKQSYCNSILICPAQEYKTVILTIRQASNIFSRVLVKIMQLNEKITRLKFSYVGGSLSVKTCSSVLCSTVNLLWS